MRNPKSAVSRRPIRRKPFKRAELFAFVFLLPWIAGFFIFVAIPIVQSFYYSFCTVNVTAGGRETVWCGWGNYIDIWQKDIYFIRRILNFILSALLQTPLIVIFALLIAIMLNTHIKGKSFFRTIFFLPVIIVSGPLINELAGQGATTIPLVEQQGISTLMSNLFPQWLAEPVITLFSQLIIILWFSGIQILLFVAALQRIDLNMMEAARIDGATSWEIFWKITSPAIRPMILLNAVYTLVYLANSDNNDVIYLISNNMLDPQRGYGFASAMAWLHTLVVLILLAVIFVLLRERSDKAKRRRRMSM